MVSDYTNDDGMNITNVWALSDEGNYNVILYQCSANWSPTYIYIKSQLFLNYVSHKHSSTPARSHRIFVCMGRTR